jgi:hypothetical protein
MGHGTFVFKIENQEFRILISDDERVKNQQMTDAIFSNEEVLKQLRNSDLESDDDLIMNKEDFLKVIIGER